MYESFSGHLWFLSYVIFVENLASYWMGVSTEVPTPLQRIFCVLAEIEIAVDEAPA